MSKRMGRLGLTAIVVAAFPVLGQQSLTLYRFDSPPKRSTHATVGGGVSWTCVPDPRDLLEHSVARLDYPQYEEGEAQWPAIRVKQPALPQTDWGVWDAFGIGVLNPENDVVDLGICVASDTGRYNVHVLLQPNVWNRRLIPMEAIQRHTGTTDIRQIDVFMTRPDQSHTLFLAELALLKTARWPDLIPRTVSLGGPDGDHEYRCWQPNGIIVETVDSPFAAGRKKATKLTFTPYSKGNPPWPSFQGWTAGGAIPRNWALFDTFEIDLSNPGSQTAPLKLMIRDGHDRKITQQCAVPAGKQLHVNIDLNGTALDLPDIRQVDLFMTRPAATHAVILDNMALCIHPDRVLDELSRQLAQAKSRLQRLPRDVARPWNDQIQNLETNLENLGAKLTGNRLRAADLRTLQTLSDRMARWNGRHSREITAAESLAWARRRSPAAAFGVAVADSMTKVMIRDMPLDGVRVAGRAELECAANETEALQIVVLAAQRALQNVTVTVSALHAEENGGSLPPETVSTNLVGHVETKEPPYAVPYVGWWPDPILDFQQNAAVKPDEAVSFWLRCRVPKGTPAGTYAGTISISADHAPTVTLPLDLTVFDFELPDGPHLPTATDFRNHVRQVYGKSISDTRYTELITGFRNTFIAHGIDFDRIYRRPPENPANLELYLDQLRYLRDHNSLSAFNICYVGTDRSITDPNHPEVTATIDRVLKTLHFWIPRLKEENLFQYAYVYGYDEVPTDVFPVIAKVYGAIKSAFPDLPLMTTARDPSFGTETCLGDVVDIFVPLTPHFDPERVAAARAQERDVWWYICIGPKHPYANWLIEYPAIEARLLMGMMTAAYRPGGFLYYALTRWPVNRAPIESGPYTTWNPMSYKDNNGDGSLFCAGPDGPLTTIRAENLRDGLEDYAYFTALDTLIEQAENVAAEQRNTPLKTALETAKQGRKVSADVVTSLTSFTEDPDVVRAERRRVARLITNLKTALEKP